MNIHVWEGYGQTDTGPQRSENQDSFITLNDIGLWCVADGMGGHKEGGIASHLATQSLEDIRHCTFESLDAVAEAVRKIVLDVNRALCEMSSSFYDQEVIGTTIVVLLIYGQRAKVIWVGDSRLYRMRGTSFELVTRDHTQYEELLSRGLVKENQPEHPAHHILTRALGAADLCELEELNLDVMPNDIFLICTDGLSNMISQMDLAKVIYYSEDKNRAVANLINMALAKNASDNVTAVIVDKVTP
ncbi:PP2C family protein-serine/threonine phosphatase [Marinomonas fungiae]|uniref:PP2C family protein-serine/threonine phosphatase n=1 Tax=Marinomonas fungiae TaxID=1137284 RepID=UPI003A8E5EC6